MFQDRVFQIAFLISIVTHGIILSQSPNFNLSPFNKRKELNVSYIKENEPLKEETRALLKSKALLENTLKIRTQKISPPPFIDDKGTFDKKLDTLVRRPSLIKPKLKRADVIAVKKKITLPEIDISKIKIPSYMNYYQIVREKVRRAAYHNYIHTEVGEVYLTFIIDNAGSIKSLRVIDEKSSATLELKEIARKSVEDAAPFPPFPKSLDYPQLSFNLPIAFEVE